MEKNKYIYIPPPLPPPPPPPPHPPPPPPPQTRSSSAIQVLQCGSFRCIENKPGSMGKPAPGMDVRVSCP